LEERLNELEVRRFDMKKQREIVYESDLILPAELRNALADVEDCVIRDRYEPDKIGVHFSWLKHRIIEWFLNHEKE
jgi:hypothetical protein